MKRLFIISIFAGLACVNLFFSAPERKFIDPTGTYILKGTLKGDRIIGHFGEIRVKLLDSKTAAICFFISKGYPGYESGAIIDTLEYYSNQLTYRPGADNACSITFAFKRDLAEIQQSYTIPNDGCGFASGVLISTYFEKSSGEIPVIQNLSSHGLAP